MAEVRLPRKPLHVHMHNVYTHTTATLPQEGVHGSEDFRDRARGLCRGQPADYNRCHVAVGDDSCEGAMGER
jgi:hypothetical protein